MQRYNLNSQQTVYIGDSTFDVEMAQRAGMQSAAVTWGAHDARSLPVSYTHLRAHETCADLVCRLLLEKTYIIEKLRK
ncbi:hypothetical protein JMUB7532_27410 [Staphylococcus aureus]